MPLIMAYVIFIIKLFNTRHEIMGINLKNKRTEFNYYWSLDSA